MLLDWLLIPLAAIVFGSLNALRGAGSQWLRYVIAFLAGALSYMIGASATASVFTAFGILIFMLQPWGHGMALVGSPRAKRHFTKQQLSGS